MNKISNLLLLVAIAAISIAFTNNYKSNKKMSDNIYDYTISSIDGEEIKLERFKGKKLLLVNVASECGYTKQYKDLQELHEKHGDKVVIIGFPCNQFGGQEPGTATEIKSFCEKNFGVTFQLTEKIDVKGDAQHPIYKWLTSKELNTVEDSKVKWNFHKYLIDENGNYIEAFASGVNPMSDKIISKL
ncbi:MAG: glutathione peroxidase [Bacteroidia bacterium]